MIELISLEDTKSCVKCSQHVSMQVKFSINVFAEVR